MADNINQYIQGLLGQNYQTPMQGGLLGAAQAVAPLAGYTSRPVSMGQVLGAAGGGALRGQQQAQMQNMMMGSNVQQMQQAQAQMEAAQRAATLAAEQRKNSAAYMTAQGGPVGASPAIQAAWMKNQGIDPLRGKSIAYKMGKEAGLEGQALVEFIKAYAVKTDAPKLPSVFDKIATDAYTGASEGSALAGQKLFALREMQSLLATGVQTGRMADASLPFKQVLAEYSGGDPNVGVQEAINSAGNKMALNEHGPGMGPLTDTDFQVYRGIAPGLKNTAAGNALTMARIERELIGKQLLHEVIKEQISKGGAKGYNSTEAWKEVSRRLDKSHGPLIPVVKDLKAAEADATLDGRVIMFNGQPYFMEP